MQIKNFIQSQKIISLKRETTIIVNGKNQYCKTKTLSYFQISYTLMLKISIETVLWTSIWRESEQEQAWYFWKTNKF